MLMRYSLKRGKGSQYNPSILSFDFKEKPDRPSTTQRGQARRKKSAYRIQKKGITLVRRNQFARKKGSKVLQRTGVYSVKIVGEWDWEGRLLQGTLPEGEGGRGLQECLL